MTTNAPSIEVVEHAAAVVMQCLDERRGTAEVMARMPALRAESSGVRAEVARIAVAVIGARRRLRFALADCLPSDRYERARAYVLMWLAERGVRVAGPDVGEWGVALPRPEHVAERLRAIEDACERLAIAHSLPDWLAAEFHSVFAGEVDAVLTGLAQAPPRTLRANLLRVASRDELVERLAAEGVDAEPARYAATAVHVAGSRDLFETNTYRDGCFEQQDEASQLAVLLTAPPPGGKVLDLCCGSGGKTLGLAAQLGNRGTVLATDVHQARVRDLRARLPRAFADNVQPMHLDGTLPCERRLEQFACRADRILIDAPCSGTGSWRRRPQARWNLDPTGLEAMRRTQAELLERAAGWLKPKARIVYATCSLLPGENEEQILALCDRHSGLEIVSVVEVLGGALGRTIADANGAFLSVRPDRHGCDGFFAAVLRNATGIGS